MTTKILPTPNWKLLFHYDKNRYHFMFQSMWDSPVSTVTCVWAVGTARDPSIVQNIQTSYTAHTFCCSIGNTGSIPESGKGMIVTTHLQLL